MPSVHCVTRSRTKLTMMRGENCIDARVSVISRMAKTIDTTVMMEAAMPPRITCATCGSECEGKITAGTQALMAGSVSSSHESSAPAQPSDSAMIRGRTRKPPRRLYMMWRTSKGRRLFMAVDYQSRDQRARLTGTLSPRSLWPVNRSTMRNLRPTARWPLGGRWWSAPFRPFRRNHGGDIPWNHATASCRIKFGCPIHHRNPHTRAEVDLQYRADG